jgi:hypothetical protein
MATSSPEAGAFVSAAFNVGDVGDQVLFDVNISTAVMISTPAPFASTPFDA